MCRSEGKEDSAGEGLRRVTLEDSRFSACGSIENTWSLISRRLY